MLALIIFALVVVLLPGACMIATEMPVKKEEPYYPPLPWYGTRRLS